MPAGPVFHVELLALSRRGRYFGLRTLYGGLLLALLALNHPYAAGWNEVREYPLGAMAVLGRTLFTVFAWTQSIALLLITPALVAGVVADERRRKTLDDLLCSCLTNREIVLGKVGARLLQVAVYLGVGLPITALITFFGGISPSDVWLLFAATASTVFFLAGLSAAVSVHSRRPTEAVTGVYLLEFAWLVLPCLLESFLHRPGSGGSGLAAPWATLNRCFGASSPLYVLMDFSPPGPNAAYQVPLMIGLQAALGAGLLGLAVARLRRVAAHAGGRRRAAGGRSLRGLLPRPECGEDPMLWKECFVSRSGRLRRLLSALAFALFAGLLAFSLFEPSLRAFDELRLGGYGNPAPNHYAAISLNMQLRLTLTLIYACLLIGASASAAGAFAGEREGDTWVSLVATPLTPLEIVRGKFFGAVWAVRWPVALYLTLNLWGVVLGATHPVGYAFNLVTTAVYTGAGAAIGLWFSFRARNATRALVATFATLVVANGAYLILAAPLLWNLPASIYAGVTFFPEALSLVNYRDFAALGNLGKLASPRGTGELVTACIVSVGGYAAAGGWLFRDLVRKFDSRLDRPAAEGSPARPAPV